MKKEVSMTIFLLLGLSFRSFAGTGNVNDGLEFLLVIIGLLITLLGIFSGVDYLRKNRKTIFYNAMSFLDKMISFLRNYINKVKSDYFDLSYF